VLSENAIQLKQWLYAGDTILDEDLYIPAYHHIRRLYPSRPDHDKILPACKVNEQQDHLQGLDESIPDSPGFDYYNEVILPAFEKVTSRGLFIGGASFEPTYYNVFTKNGRATKRHVSGSTVYDKTGLASKYTSRYTNGKLYEVDYDAHHLRLISKQIDFTAPETSFHRYLANHYYDTDNYDYTEAKQVTFQAMYGRMPEEFNAISFFKLLNEFKQDLWSKYLKDGFVACPASGRRISNNIKDSGQLLNYYICALETCENAETINNLNIVPSMYAYDSFLFDTETAIENIVSQLPHPVTVKEGTTFHDIRSSN